MSVFSYMWQHDCSDQPRSWVKEGQDEEEASVKDQPKDPFFDQRIEGFRKSMYRGWWGVSASSSVSCSGCLKYIVHQVFISKMNIQWLDAAIHACIVRLGSFIRRKNQNLTRFIAEVNLLLSTWPVHHTWLTAIPGVWSHRSTSPNLRLGYLLP